MASVFVVTQSEGHYSERNEWPIRVYDNEPAARAFVKACEEHNALSQAPARFVEWSKVARKDWKSADWREWRGAHPNPDVRDTAIGQQGGRAVDEPGLEEYAVYEVPLVDA